MTETIVAIGAAVAALGIIGRAAWTSFRAISNAYQWLREIHQQLSPNAGSSLSDILHRVDENDLVAHRNIEVVYGVVLKMHDLDPDLAPLLEVPRTAEAQKQEAG